METKTICKNCEAQLEETFRYCPFCSQEAEDQVTLKTLFHNTISNYFCVDARFFKSFVPLMFRPGLLPKRFVGGKRMLYLHPAQFYLFVSIIFFFLFSFVAREQEQKVAKVWDSAFDSDESVVIQPKSLPVEATIENNSKSTIELGQGQSEIDSLIAIQAPEKEILTAMGLSEEDGTFKKRLYSQALKVYKRHGSGILQGFYDSIPIALFILLPIFALLLKLFYYRKGRFAHHLVFSFYFFSFMFVVFSILLITSFMWKTMPGWLTTLTLFSTYFYFWFGAKRFYCQGYTVTFFKSATIGFLFLLFVIPLSVAVLGFTTFLFY